MKTAQADSFHCSLFPHHATMFSSSTIAFPKLIWLPKLPFSLSPSKLPTSVRYCGFYLGKLLCPIIRILLCLRHGMSGVQELFRTSSSLHGASLGMCSWDSLRSMGPDFWDPVPVIMEGRWGHRPWYILAALTCALLLMTHMGHGKQKIIIMWYTPIHLQYQGLEVGLG